MERNMFGEGSGMQSVPIGKKKQMVGGVIEEL